MSGAQETQALPFGPVQMLMLEFDRTSFDGQIMPEIERLKDAGIIRLIDLLFVTKRDGEIETIATSDLTTEEAEDLGALIGALIGVGMGAEDLEESMAAGASLGADGHLLDEAEAWYLADALPDGSSAAIALIEHRWAIPLRDKILEADGIVLADEWIHPADLLAISAAAKGAATAGG